MNTRLGAFFKNNYERHLKTINKILHNTEASEDVVQEAYYRACKYEQSYDSTRSSFNTWFNKILFNSLRDYQRSDKDSGVDHDADVELEIEVVSPSKTLENLHLIEQEISRFGRKGKNRRILELFYLKGYSSYEISQIEEDVSVSNVTSINHLFKRKLEDRYGVKL